MGTRRRIAALLLTLPPLALSGTAGAWDRDTHVAIVRAALRISPEAEARIPPAYREALYQCAAEADPNDRECRYHTEPGESDAASKADRLLKQLHSGQGLERAYVRAQAVGRFLHFVADSVVPQTYLEGGTSAFFGGADFVIFREPRPIGDPFAERLREAARDLGWSEESASARTASFRYAVNVVADAILRLPAVSDAEAVAAGVPPVDTSGPGEVLFACFNSSVTDSSTANLPHRRGLRVAEWTKSATGAAARVLLVNNDPKCATNIRLERGDWKARLTKVSIAPWGVRVIEVQGPKEKVQPEEVRGNLDAYACTGPFAPEMGAASRRMMVGTGSPSPRVEQLTELSAPR